MKGLIDSTLREGMQRVGIGFNLEQKQEIISGLLAAGIEEIELGMISAYDKDAARLLDWCRRNTDHRRYALWSRCRPDDIRAAAALGPDVLSLSIPVSDLHIEKKLERDRAWVLATLRSGLELAAHLGFAYVSVGLEDATRAEENFLTEVFHTIRKGGARRIRLADTVGISGPTELSELVKRALDISGLEVGVHTHNDFGMATANALAALESGAHWADATIMGLGERAGNARMEELASFLHIRRQRAYDPAGLVALAKRTADMAGRAIAPDKPMLGEHIFACETGLHLQGLVREPASYEPFPPEKIGARRDLRIGAKVGKKTLRDQMRITGTSLSETQLEELVKNIRTLFGEQGVSLPMSVLDGMVITP
ncbi:MAG: pyruvate carboxyltransferase [Desulfobulbaceae bacterium]|nr:pyruvate carboxyltransferase [Desulfobulbaceae bacterium]